MVSSMKFSWTAIICSMCLLKIFKSKTIEMEGIIDDYNVTIQNHLKKANMVAGALSHKVISIGSFSFFRVSRRPLAKEFQTLVSQ